LAGYAAQAEKLLESAKGQAGGKYDAQIAQVEGLLDQFTK
jgi:hypothetical protein